MTDILAAIDDPALLGASIKDPVSWRPWRALLAAAFGLPMDDEAADLFRACTGRSALPTAPFEWLWLCIGRRGGKSFTMSILACYMACFRDWRKYLSPGERAVVLLVAADRDQAKILLRYINGILSTPVLQTLVIGQTADVIELKGGVAIEVAARSYRNVRSRSVCTAILDELAFWYSDSDSRNPDVSVLEAVRPSMATFGKEAMVIGASSPYSPGFMRFPHRLFQRSHVRGLFEFFIALLFPMRRGIENMRACSDGVRSHRNRRYPQLRVCT